MKVKPKCNHKQKTKELGYSAWTEWADLKIRRGHKQHFCPVCKKYFFKCELWKNLS